MANADAATERRRFRLWRRRSCPVPTWQGSLLAFLLFAVLTVTTVPKFHQFLALNRPLERGILVVEGWLPDYAMEQALEHYRTGRYTAVYVTGGPLEYGGPLSEYRTYAEAGAAILTKLGVDTNRLFAVPAPKVRQDRTYASALELKRWLASHHTEVHDITVLTQALHARRSCLLFAKAFGPGVQVGSIAIDAESYDSDKWWKSSQGVRGVISETLAYIYARVFFRQSLQD